MTVIIPFPDPLGGVNGQIFKFRNKLLILITSITHADRGTINMKRQTRFCDSRPVSHSLGGLRGWGQMSKFDFAPGLGNQM